ncbi:MULTISPECIES: hypothetical protein [unclassified Thioalkalivibrio]|uniref:PFGI-1 class ICE element type IV pilus protein PilL2 n=1 Tax=unclassified Thioalkalivibrio TaxID=2621013 RepID=UPI00037FE5C0
MALAFTSWGSAAATDIQVGRYLTAADAPAPEQVQPLQVTVQMDFPSDIQHVGAALTYLLTHSGYRLEDPATADPAMRVLLTRPLPEVHRELGPLSLENALTTLAGSTWRLVVDPTMREISYEPREPYAEAARARGRAIEADNVRDVLAPKPPTTRMYGPVQRGETLRSIAEAISPGQPVRMAAALFEANPHAFFPANAPNPNQLRTGVELEIPSDAAANHHSPSRARSILRGDQ